MKTQRRRRRAARGGLEEPDLRLLRKDGTAVSYPTYR